MDYDIVTIGAGPVGIFSAFQAGMLGMRVCVIDSAEKIGGQCRILYPQKPIYDIPSHRSISAENLIKNLVDQASRFNPEYILGTKVLDVQKQNDDCFYIRISNGKIIKTKAVLIAAGSGEFVPNKPPIQGIEHYENKSVFYNVQDTSIFKDKILMIAGGGDSSIDWCLELFDIAKKIYLLHRRRTFKAAQSNLIQLENLMSMYPSKIEIVSPFQLYEVQGNAEQIETVSVKDLENNIKTFSIDSLLLFFGLVQNIGPLSKIGLDMKGHYIIVDPIYYQTNIEGIYAIGDVAQYTGKIKLILTGFAEASSAIYHMYPKIFNKPLHFEYSTSKIKI